MKGKEYGKVKKNLEDCKSNSKMLPFNEKLKIKNEEILVSKIMRVKLILISKGK
jgi:hypothetical protein